MSFKLYLRSVEQQINAFFMEPINQLENELIELGYKIHSVHSAWEGFNHQSTICISFPCASYAILFADSVHKDLSLPVRAIVKGDHVHITHTRFKTA